MSIVEIGCMGAKPDLEVMKNGTAGEQILRRTWNTIIAAPGGPRWISWGLEIEDSSKFWSFFEWGSVEEHENFARSLGAEAVKDLPKIFTHGEFTKHISVTPSPLLALQSPITEVITAFFPADISSTSKDVVRDQLQQIVESSLGDHLKLNTVSCGWGMENDFPIGKDHEEQTGSILVAFIGWHSIEAYGNFKAAKEYKKYLDMSEGIEGLVNIRRFQLCCQSLMKAL